jgi:hypothetical protein
VRQYCQGCDYAACSRSCKARATAEEKAFGDFPAWVLNLAISLTTTRDLAIRPRERVDQLTTSATAMPTATADNPPTTKTIHTTSLASSRTVFHIDVLPPRFMKRRRKFVFARALLKADQQCPRSDFGNPEVGRSCRPAFADRGARMQIQR